MAQSMVIGLLLVMAAIAGALCIWLFARGARRAPAAQPDPVEAPAPSARPQTPPRASPAVAVDGYTPPPPGAVILEPQTLSDARAFRAMFELAFGPQAYQAPPEQDQRLLAEYNDDIFERLATNPKYAMRRPMMLPQLLRAVHDRNSTQHQLASIFGRDPALAGSLLKVANSPLYRVGEAPIESLDRAVALLGTDGLRSLIATVLVQPVFKLAASEWPRFPEIVWEHTFRAARAAESYAALVEDDDPFAAQLLALTMGLGVIVIYRIALDRSRDVLQGRALHPAAIIALIDAYGAGVAKHVAASWELSERVLTALEEQRPRNPAAALVALSPLGRSLAFGRKLAALAVLYGHGRIAEDSVRASMAREGLLPDPFDRIWTRLVAQAETAGR